jgi:hypothetical protein
MSHAAFLPPDLGSFCRPDEFGLQVAGQRLEPGRAVLACRVVETDERVLLPGRSRTWAANVSGCRYGVAMTAQPENDPGSYEVIHLGGEVAAIVPLPDLRRLQAVHRHASAEQLEEAEVEATLTAHREWVAAGRPGAVSHKDAMAELLGSQ